MNRELLMLAKPFDPDKHFIAGWYCSIKLDGQRAFWDGGVTRGKSKSLVPWANTAKDERYVNEQISTGLWSRYGNVIHASDSFIDELPEGICLDGELWYDRGEFQSLRSIVSGLNPNESLWEDIKFLIFEQPPIEVFCLNGQINNPQFTKYIKYVECKPLFKNFQSYVPLFKELKSLPLVGRCEHIEQIQLSGLEHVAREELYNFLDQETDKNGEGLMLRDPFSCYQVRRSQSLLKVKPFEIDSGVVIGFKMGEGKYENMLGSLLIEWKDKKFNLSGFTDTQRRLIDGPKGLYPPLFPIGQIINFKYASLTKKGLPREGRYVK